jgi:hypothetical protein
MRRLSNYDENAHFTYHVTIPIDTQVSVSRRKKRDYYITISTGVIIGPKDQSIQVAINNLSKEQSEQVRNELILEMAKLNVQWEVSAMPLKDISLFKLVPITSSLTEDVFLAHLLQMGNAALVARASVIRAVTYARQSP